MTTLRLRISPPHAAGELRTKVQLPNVNGVRTDPGRVLGKRPAQIAGAEALGQAFMPWGLGTVDCCCL